MDQKHATELLNFMHKALSNKLIEAGPCRYIAAAFMIPKSDPNKPYRVRKLTQIFAEFQKSHIFLQKIFFYFVQSAFWITDV